MKFASTYAKRNLYYVDRYRDVALVHDLEGAPRARRRAMRVRAHARVLALAPAPLRDRAQSGPTAGRTRDISRRKGGVTAAVPRFP